MKVGMSLGKCVRDIFSGKVKYDDVLIIISNTSFNPNTPDHWAGLWDGYSKIDSYWRNYKDQEHEIRDLCLRLYRDGKLHQPRRFGKDQQWSSTVWFNICLTDEDHNKNPSAKLAYEKYRTLAGLI